MAYTNDVSIDNENFYTITGENITRQIIVQRMINSFNEKYPDSEITDFNEGSQIRNTIESYAVEGYYIEKNSTESQRIAFINTAYGRWLDNHGTDLNTPRNTGTQSTGTVTFSIPSAVDYNILIPANTVLVSSETGLDFLTMNDIEIKLGETTANVTVMSRVIGTETNAEANTINIFRDTKPSELLSVTNAEACTGGTNPETDDEYRIRLLQVKNSDGFGSKEYYIQLGESVPGVHDVALVDEVGYTAKVLVNGFEKPLDDVVLGNVTAKYSTEANLVYNHNFVVSEVDYTEVNLEITAGVTDTVDDSLFINLLTALFYGNVYEIFSSNSTLDTIYPGLNINQGLTNYQLLSALESLPFVVQVTSLTSDGELFSKLEPDTNEVLKIGTVTITQDVVE